MKRADAVAAGFAGTGILIILAGAVLAAVLAWEPRVRDAVHSVGLLVMLLGAGIFLLSRRRDHAAPREKRRSPPSGWQETSKNLVIAGATFLIGSLAAGMSLVRVLAFNSLVPWILATLAALGGAALLVGAVGYGFARILDPPRDPGDNS
jgi:hypothetical protein